MLEKLYLKNFKAFCDNEINFKPITLFLGPNNSGKSSILSAIRILSQTCSSSDKDIPLLLNGKLGDFGTYRDIVHKNAAQSDMHIHITTNLPRYGQMKIELVFMYRAKLKQIILKKVNMYSKESELIKSTYSRDSEKQIIDQLGNVIIPTPSKSAVSKTFRWANFLPERVFLYRSDTTESFFETIEPTIFRKVALLSNSLSKELQDIEYIGAMRMPPARTYLYTGEKRRHVGVSGENCANMLAMDSLRTGSRSKNILKKCVAWLKTAEIANDIKIESLSSRHYEIRVQHPNSMEYQNFADVGYGNSQILPILVAGYNLEEQCTLLVEEPEIHLHPRAQAELGSFFYDMYKGGIQSIIETHSEHLVVRLQTLVAKGDINKDDVIFYYVYPQNGKKIISSLTLDDLGKFTTEWPKGFFPERLSEAKQLAKIRFAKEMELDQ